MFDPHRHSSCVCEFQWKQILKAISGVVLLDDEDSEGFWSCVVHCMIMNKRPIKRWMDPVLTSRLTLLIALTGKEIPTWVFVGMLKPQPRHKGFLNTSHTLNATNDSSNLIPSKEFNDHVSKTKLQKNCISLICRVSYMRIKWEKCDYFYSLVFLYSYLLYMCI